MSEDHGRKADFIQHFPVRNMRFQAAILYFLVAMQPLYTGIPTTEKISD